MPLNYNVDLQALTHRQFNLPEASSRPTRLLAVADGRLLTLAARWFDLHYVPLQFLDGPVDLC